MAQHYRRKLSQNLDRMRKERVIKDMGTRQPVKAINNFINTEENAQRRSRRKENATPIDQDTKMTRPHSRLQQRYAKS